MRVLRALAPFLALVAAAWIGACGTPVAPSPVTGLDFQPITAPGTTIALECPLNRCGTAPLSFSVRAVAGSPVAAASVRSRLLEATGRECLFVFAPRQDVLAGQPATFHVERVLVTETAPGQLACPPPFTTTAVDMALLDGTGAIVLTGRASASYVFVLPPGVKIP